MEKLEKQQYLDVQWGSPKMPDDVKDEFFEHFSGRSLCNDVWVEYSGGCAVLDEWLTANTDWSGTVFLKHWW